MVALACWRPTLRGVWRQVLALALLAGLLGGVALGAVAGARRTASAYGQYLAAIKASDVFVNVPGTLPGMAATRPYELISALPGVVAHAAYIGLSGAPPAARPRWPRPCPGWSPSSVAWRWPWRPRSRCRR
jgi:hypothetical protein